MNLKCRQLSSFTLGANFAGPPAWTSSDLALPPIWMHRTSVGSRASDPGPGFPGISVQRAPKNLARDLPQNRAQFPPDQGEGGVQGKRGVSEAQEKGLF